MPTKIYIGTSGIVLPVNKAAFPIEFKSTSRLTYYSTLFNSVEVNSTFYKTPRGITFAKWKNEASSTFKFTVKLSKNITHSPNLLYEAREVEEFLDAANELNEKKAVLLIQFPSKITVDYIRKVEHLINQLRRSPSILQWQLAVEVRHQSWYVPKAYNMFNQLQASLVFHDMPDSKTPLNQTAVDVIYLRYHGPSGDYRGSYSNDFIGQQAEKIENWVEYGKTVFVYFNNTLGAAYENARLLQSHLKEVM